MPSIVVEPTVRLSRFEAMQDHGKARFRCRPEPSGSWMVWDESDNAPGTLGGRSLVGRTWQRAKVACDLLARIYDNRLDARSLGKPRAHPVDRVDELISSIRRARD
ncbi:MAG: hypothetical protein EOS58_18120 [Mesorhizobium sp.]|uniref:hypothetical protein n=1 Tax=unclassified Mesorhizobium TaxID=325217 RepID=UPI000F751855|nr:MULTISPECIES: hypothetical protein [unclassified Mesorhizobium]RVD68585.1 hypothetical protein EN751_30600 [Mesorhizobium sp. M4A.F.Ca.ET.029.04.2.1]AZO47883.1 hypothetical protein EJ073_08650 [Mesorhizobium sp. M4B.F.Ca.ET.058.02.1.1]RUX47994.1 hypothetical protein EOA33_16870 [Mesorhizobium sp. M4A.F.Ca.ET.050.02.1.1]RVC43843.1 hypothetical protein EN781_16535 [Mesorhizobium sp. M4A.F.Ca.ET.090.04.2.1]RVC75234.1 hypothetical protein EN745_28035 [Mesorhizobium sp. M4A.F.Ca.ET.022.05.2.1]